jgi:hypothetical protein
VFLLVSAVAISAMAAAPTTQQRIVPVHTGEQTAAAMHAVVWNFTAEVEPLEAVLRRFASVAHVTLDVRWEALAEANVRPEMRVSMTAGKTEAENVLARVLEAARDAVNVADPALWPVFDVLDGGTVLVTTRRDLFTNFATERRYQVAGLVDAKVFKGAQRDAKFKELADIVEMRVGPKSWRTKPGTIGGDVRVEGSALVISQTDGNHRAVAQVLGGIRAERRQDAPAAAAVQKPAQQRAVEIKPAPPEPPTKTELALRKKLGDLRLQGRALAEVFDELREQSGQQIFVNWRAMESVHVTRDMPVTTNLSRLSLGDALDKLLTEIGGTQERFGYAVDDEVITVTTLKDLGRNTLTRVYDVRNAIKTPETRGADLADLMKRIRGIDPLSWREAGGATGSMRELQGQLIITQTPEVQKRIREELEEILPADGKEFPLLNTKVKPAQK